METRTKRVKRPTGEALRAPLAGSPAFVFAFVFILISVQFELRNETIENWLTDPRREQKTAYEKKS